MALDKTGTFLYYAQCCGKCIISRINVNDQETSEPQVVYSDFGKTCYNLAIVEDKLFFDLKEVNQMEYFHLLQLNVPRITFLMVQRVMVKSLMIECKRMEVIMFFTRERS